MFVIKRNGERANMRYDSITDRNAEYAKDLSIDVAHLSQLIIQGLKSGMTTEQIDILSAETAFYLSCFNPDYDTFASRIFISNLRKTTPNTLIECVNECVGVVHPKTGKQIHLLQEELVDFIKTHADRLQSMIDYSRDNLFNYFGLRTLTRLYLLKVNNKVVECPQHMWMRVAIAIHYTTDALKVEESLSAIKETYDALSNHLFTHASPTLFNAGNPVGNLSSCFLLDMSDDLDHIFTTISRCANISKLGGGIGFNASKIRAKGSPIHSTNGSSDGLVPMLKVFNSTANYCNQAGKRAGSFAAYLEPSHPDILDFLALRLPSPPEELRARELFLAVWLSDLFMKRVEEDGTWSLFCPSVAPQLNELYSSEYEEEYTRLETEKKYTRQLPARDVWKAILQSQIETGLPYVCYKDSINEKSNQKNIGMIRSSNLCVSGGTEICTKGLFGSPEYYTISQFKDTLVEIWNGKRWTDVRVRKTSDASELYRVTFSNDKFIDCTDYHKIPVGTTEDGTFIFKHLKDCNVGTTLVDYITWEGGKSEPEDGHEVHYMGQYSQKKEKGITITSITKLPGLHPTYCFTDELDGTGLFNGVMLGNCAEIVEYTDPNTIAVCNLSSVALPKFVTFSADKTPSFDYSELMRVVRIMTRNLNKVIDRTNYPVEEGKDNNLKYRPIGIGVQGLADVFALFKTEWGSHKATYLNQTISEAIYYAALDESCKLAQAYGPYAYFSGSPASKGILQYDMWGVKPLSSASNVVEGEIEENKLSLDWDRLKASIIIHGLRNSLLCAYMPTASSSQILKCNECFEPFTSNIYSRSTNSGEFLVVNQHLYRDLKELGLWTPELVDQIIEGDGSIQHIQRIPVDIRNRYKTVWEISQKILIDYASARGAFIDQTQSMNLFMSSPTYSKLSSMHLYGWKSGLKTGCYYLRSKAARNAVKFTIQNTSTGGEVEKKKPENSRFKCVGEAGCESCSS